MAERVFTMDFTPSGTFSCVLLDGEDISNLLRAVTVHSGAGEPTRVNLFPAAGQRVNLIARLPEALVIIEGE